jgi:ribulose 1,5-bisphosphate synthetase/thiazole synthase
MHNLPEHETSLWKSSITTTPYEALLNDLSVDVAIVGGGITGLTTAYLLKRSGVKVAVLEKNRIGSGTTGGTTGKVTSQHGLIAYI